MSATLEGRWTTTPCCGVRNRFASDFKTHSRIAALNRDGGQFAAFRRFLNCSIHTPGFSQSPISVRDTDRLGVALGFFSHVAKCLRETGRY
jgi:hypothetical protein